MMVNKQDVYEHTDNFIIALSAMSDDELDEAIGEMTFGERDRLRESLDRVEGLGQ